jgi:hypothetical protein
METRTFIVLSETLITPKLVRNLPSWITLKIRCRVDASSGSSAGMNDAVVARIGVLHFSDR